tara:strand:- start:32 stop:295 length:264 start_codon:yes stop_codon:yes gene_type:complete
MDAKGVIVLMFVLTKLATATKNQKTLIQQTMASDSIHPSWVNPEHDDGFDTKEFQQCTKCEYILYLEDVESNLCPMCGHEIVSEVWR